MQGGIKGNRKPFLQYEHARYTNSILRSSPHLAGELLTIRVDSRDLRTLRAFLPNGTPLGSLRAERRWATTRHSLQTRRIIVAESRAAPLIGPDYLDLPALWSLELQRRALSAKRDSTRLAKIRTEQDQVENVIVDTSEDGAAEDDTEIFLDQSRLEGFGARYRRD